MSYRRLGALQVGALMAATALLVSACGSRITEEERAFALSGGGGGAVGDGSLAVGNGDLDLADPEGGGSGLPEFDDLDLSDGANGGGSSADTGGGEGGDETSNGGEGGASNGGGSGGGGANGGSRDTRAAPPGGNGGATDTGVTEDRIVVANVADISGAVPGLFEDAQKGAAAYVAYFTGTEGTVYGRQLELLPLDSRMDSGQARQHYLRACEQAFAAVGSMSAFEEGAAGPVESCGIPDLRSVVTSRQMQNVDNAFGMEVQQEGVVLGAAWRYWANREPEAIKRSAYLWIENETTRFQTRQNISATSTIGYEWVVDQPVGIAETNYDGFVLDMQRQDVDFVTFQGDYTQAVRLANAMRRQNFWPSVYALQPNTYTPKLLEAGGAAIEDTEIYISTAPVEEIGSNEEMQTYRQWLRQIDPRAEPSYLGIYGWSAMKMFVQSLKEVGPELTREALLEEVRSVRDWDGDGLHAPQHVGPKEVNDCTLVLQVRDNSFRRLEPSSSGFRCEDGILQAR